MRVRSGSRKPGAASVIIASVLSFGIAPTPGCDGGGLGGRSVSCRDYCAKLELCDDRTDQAGCEEHCDQQRVRSEEYLEVRASCVQSRSCNIFSGELGPMGEDLCRGDTSCVVNDCTNDAIALRARTTAEESYCSTLASKLNACDRSVEPPVLTGRCLELMPTLSSEYLELVEGCVQGDCSQVQSCLRSVADRYNTDVTPAPADWLDSPRT